MSKKLIAILGISLSLFASQTWAANNQEVQEIAAKTFPICQELIHTRYVFLEGDENKNEALKDWQLVVSSVSNDAQLSPETIKRAENNCSIRLSESIDLIIHEYQKQTGFTKEQLIQDIKKFQSAPSPINPNPKY
ncbi:hypothetical protein [Neisseria animalis]|uniref:Uncharacterized protein n=1 Tax=Neisseria animalis TaxID=492 RepID=A0A5P3MQU2_NEIAN|nr:hypothetical protein [Neisseria animalis]QEY23425.1 hypothetical protein D0T90_02010 [Neisseria animalis]ROW33271.1 hypothetical protein CGZ60_00755 [Neisseria animalis]VEE08908.1 Uncharacterised protein [Neisseria animalis]